MRRRTVLGLGIAGLLAVAVAASAVTGMGLCTHQSGIRPGGEVGDYFTCTCIAAARAFKLNYSPAAPDTTGTFFRPRRECPLLVAVADAHDGWRD